MNTPAALTRDVTRSKLTAEQWRILVAIDDGRLSMNSAGRYVIDGEERPDRKSRERLRGRGLIDHFYEQGRGTHWRVTAKGKAMLRAAGFGVRS